MADTENSAIVEINNYYKYVVIINVVMLGIFLFFKLHYLQNKNLYI